MANTKRATTNRSARAAAKRSKAKQVRKKKATPVQAVRGLGRPGAATLAGVTADPAADNLRKIDKIVVLMMENRSFDHMLGYLKLEGNRDDVEGLTPGLSNSDGQTVYSIHHLDHTALKSSQDPCHSGQCVDDQLQNNNGGFVKNYVDTHRNDPERDLVMGYYNQNELATYDYLAGEFVLCDHWFASVPGATWPNRLYAVTGRADVSKNNKTIPIYNLPAFVRKLDAKKVSWDWYSDNFFGSTLNLTDGRYRSRSVYDLDHSTSRRPTALYRVSVGSIRSLSIAPVSLWPTTIIRPPTSAAARTLFSTSITRSSAIRLSGIRRCSSSFTTSTAASTIISSRLPRKMTDPVSGGTAFAFRRF